MGTNYYTKINNCDKCGRYDKIHLGKSSAGWQFYFQYNGGKYYKNVDEMTVWLIDKEIKNEYGEVISHDDFWKMVQEKQSENKADGTYDLVIDGYTFSDFEFS